MKHRIDVAVKMGAKPMLALDHVVDDAVFESISIPIAPSVSVDALNDLSRMLARFDYNTADHVGEPEDPEGVA